MTRNLCVVGHGSVGKTTLVEAMLFDAGKTNRMGRVEQGNTVCDFDAEEIKRQISINTSVVHFEHRGCLFNVLDVPGYPDFTGDIRSSMRASDVALVVLCGVAGVEVQTENVWGYAQEFGMPVVFAINRLDRDNADFYRVLEQIREYLSPRAVAVALPIGSQKDFRGLVDLLSGKAYSYAGDGSREFREVPVPKELEGKIGEHRERLVETIVESDEELMTRYLEGEEISAEELKACLRRAIAAREIFPVLPLSASSNVGVLQLLDFAADSCPSPLEMPPRRLVDGSGQEVELRPDPSGPFVALVFKVMVDPYVGKMNYIRVFSGTLRSDQGIYNVNKREEERIPTFKRMVGKEGVDVSEVTVGDVVAVPKLQSPSVGHTLSTKGFDKVFPPLSLPEPVYFVAVEPRSRADEDKLSNALHRMLEEDPTISYRKDPDTGDNVVAGLGDVQLDVMLSRLKDRYGVELEVRTPKVPYRETIKKPSKAQGKYKKQTGGRGQYGDVWIEYQPLPRGAGFEFEERIFGGAVPKQYIPAVEKGLREAMQKGVLAGYPTVDFKAILYDGSYHEVDSSEMAFKIAASLSFKQGVAAANPVLLEPIMNVEVEVPEEYTGDVMGDMNSRRGRIMGMESKGRKQVIKAQVPLAEMFSYAIVLRSMTSGRGSFRMSFSHYEEVPAEIARRIIAEAQREREEEK